MDHKQVYPQESSADISFTSFGRSKTAKVRKSHETDKLLETQLMPHNASDRNKKHRIQPTEENTLQDTGEKQRLEDMTDTLLHQIVTNDGQIFDPAAKLDFQSQLEANDECQNTFFSPADFSECVQTLPILLENDDVKIMTVHRVQRNVSQSQPEQFQQSPRKNYYEQSSNPEIKPTSCKLDARIDKDDALNRAMCCKCHQIRSKSILYEYQNGGNSDSNSKEFICAHCHTKKFVTQKLLEKTDMHKYFERVVLQSRFGTDNQKGLDEEWNRTARQDESVNSNFFAKLIKDPAQDTDTPLPFGEQAIIALWQANENGQFECYFTHNVLNPLFFYLEEPNSDNQKSFSRQTLLIENDLNQVCYFERAKGLSDKQINCIVIDLQVAIKEEADHSNKFFKGLNTYPLKGGILNLFRGHFALNQPNRTLTQVLPKFRGTIMQFYCPRVIFNKNDQPDTFDFESSISNNCIIFDLEDQEQLARVIPNMVFIQFSEENLSSKLIICCIYKKDICLVKWENVLQCDNATLNRQTKAKNYLPPINQKNSANVGPNTLNVPNKDKFVLQVSAKIDQTWHGSMHSQNKFCKLWSSNKIYVLHLDEKDNQAKEKLYEDFSEYSWAKISNAPDKMIRIQTDDKNNKSFCLFSFKNVEAVSKVTEYQDLYIYDDNTSIDNLSKCKFTFSITSQYQSKKGESQGEKNRMYMFNVQVVGYDNQAHQLKTLYFNAGTDEPEDMKKLPAKWQKMQPTDQPSPIYKVQWPLLAHSSVSPLRNEIMVSNFMQNEPQNLINLGKYKLLAFVDTGFMKHFEDKQWDSLFFLVSESSKNQARLMRYRFQPFPIDDKNEHVRQSNGTLCIMSGRIKFDQESQFDLKKNQIIKVCYMGGQFIIIQFADQIAAFNMIDSRKPPRLFKQDQAETITRPMISGTKDVVFYIKQTEDQYDVMMIYSQDKEVKETLIHSQSEPILQIQIATDQDKIDGYHCLYIQGTKNLILLTHNKGEFKSKKLITNNFENKEWNSSLCLSARQNTHIQNGKFVTYAYRAREKIAHQSTKFMSEYMQLLGDVIAQNSEQNMLAQNKITYHPIGVESLNGLGQVLFRAREENLNYYLVKQSFDYRQILFSAKQDDKKICESISFACNKIAVKNYGQVSFFNQKNFMFNKSEPFEDFQEVKRKSIDTDDEFYYVTYKNNQTKKITKQLVELSPSTFTFQIAIDNVFEKQKYLKQEIQSIDILENIHDNMWIEKEKNLNYVYFAKNEFPGYPVESKMTQIFKLDLEIDKAYELAPDDIQDSRYKRSQQQLKPTLYIVISDEFDEKQREFYDFCFTDNYLVIKTKDEIWFTELKKIDEINRQMNLTHKKRSQVQNRLLDISMLHEKIYQKKHEVQLQKVPLKDLFDARLFQHGFNISLVPIDSVSIQQPATVSWLVENDNLQIQFEHKDKELTMFWDLKANGQIREVSHLSQFSAAEIFVPQGTSARIADIDADGNYSFKTIHQNYEKSLFAIPKIKQQEPQLFKMYSTFDLWRMRELAKKIEIFEKPDIDLQTLFCNFYGQNFFDIFKDHPEVFEYLKEWIDDYETQLDKLEITEDMEIYELRKHQTIDQIFTYRKSYDMYLRRLYTTLKQPLTEDLYDDQESVLHCHQVANKKYLRAFKNETILNQLFRNQKKRELQKPLESLFQMLKQFDEVHLSDFLTRFDDFTLCFDAKIQFILDFVNKTKVENENTKQVLQVFDNSNEQVRFFTSSTSRLSESKIKKCIEEEQSKLPYLLQLLTCRKSNTDNIKKTGFQLKNVKIHIIEIGWNVNNLEDFYRYLSTNNINVASQELITNLVKSQNYSQQIIWQVFPLYIAYSIASLIYLSHYDVLHSKEGTEERHWYGYTVQLILGFFIFGFSIFHLAQEFNDFNKAKVTYFQEAWNYIHLTIGLLNMLIVGETVFSIFYHSLIGPTVMVYLVSILVMSIWLNMFYWARLFPNLGVYVQLIKETFIDITQFIVLFIFIVFLFANAYYIIDKSNEAAEWNPEWGEPDLENCIPSGGKIVKDIELSENNFINTVYYVYLLSLGENYLDNYENTNYPQLLWGIFFLATVVLQLVFLNMIIAIMSDTYTKVMDRKDEYKLDVYAEVYADYFDSIKLDYQELVANKYLYVVTVEGNDEIKEWQTGVKTLKDKLQKHEKTIKNSIQEAETQLTNNLNTVIAENQHLKTSNKNLEAGNKKLEAGHEELKSQMNRLEDMMSQVLAQLNNKQQ